LNAPIPEQRTSHPAKWVVRRSTSDRAWCSREVRCVTDTNTDAWVSSSHRPMGFPEFVVMIASIMALNPLAMDMKPYPHIIALKAV
jgi:MFS transporter, DHA1 family, multidrug resistance protein